MFYIKERCGFWATIGQRLSSRLYYLGGIPKSYIGEVIKRSLCAVTQALYLSLDKLDRQKGDTLGYIMVAKKRTEK